MDWIAFCDQAGNAAPARSARAMSRERRLAIDFSQMPFIVAFS